MYRLSSSHKGIVMRQSWKDWYNANIYGSMLKTIKPKDTILELGCGGKSLIVKTKLNKTHFVTAVDIWQPYIDKHIADKDYTECRCEDITQSRFNGKFDVVVCMDVIEHFQKQDGLDLLTKMKAWGRRVIVTCPQHSDQSGFENPYNDHVSYWSVEDFTERGFDVRGLSGWEVLRIQGARLRWDNPIGASLSAISLPVAYVFPKIAWHLQATWESKV